MAAFASTVAADNAHRQAETSNAVVKLAKDNPWFTDAFRDVFMPS